MILSVLYPDSESNKEIILTSSCVGILLYLFLIVYQPFGTGQFEHAYKYLLLFPYALFTAFSFCSVNLFVMKQKRKWTLGSELFKTGLILVLISLLSYFYNALFLSKVKLSFENFLYMFFYTSALGLPVSSIAILARYIYLNNHNKAPVTAGLYGNERIAEIENGVEINEINTTLYIVADCTNFSLEIEQKDFVFAEAADNYCIVHFYENGILQKEIIRISLTRLLHQIQTDTIKKVHRSFIVNLKNVTKFKGNSSGYKIALENIEKELTISRNYVNSVIPILKNVARRP